MTQLMVRPVQASDAKKFASYGYPPPYDFYDSTPGSAAQFLDPANRFLAVCDAQDNLWGFGCVGGEARVPGGRYVSDGSVLDVGVGMSPARAGRGQGRVFCVAVVDFASELEGDQLQVTVAAFNTRSLRVWDALGFVESHRFVSQDRHEFVQLVRDG